MRYPDIVAHPDWYSAEFQPKGWANQKKLPPYRRCFLPASPEGACKALWLAAVSAAEQLREELHIEIEEDPKCRKYMPPPIRNFEELGILPDYVLQALAKNSIQSPLPIQAQALPLILAGQNVIGLAQTGSGKTLAFLLPAVVHVEAQPEIGSSEASPIVLVLAPTRELAIQINEESRKILRDSHRGNHPGGVWATCLYGGANKQNQLRGAYGCQIAVATPGRLKDFVEAGQVSLGRVTYFVLDEADRMLDLGFQQDVMDISKEVRPDRQVLFFSATWQAQVQQMARSLCSGSGEPVRLAMAGDVAASGEGEAANTNHGQGRGGLQTRAGITQQVLVIDHPDDYEKQVREKEAILDDYLKKVLTESSEHKVLVFVGQKDFADELCNRLWHAGFDSEAMHGGKAQSVRINALDRFREGYTRVLVATDVLGRGIDIPNVSHVVIYEMCDLEDYIHRVGRTARGRDGKGHALIFFEYYHKEPQLASELIDILEASGQEVPKDLCRVAEEVRTGMRKVARLKGGSGKQAGDWAGEAASWCS